MSRPNGRSSMNRAPSVKACLLYTSLAAFLFTGDDVFKQIKMLSGGERGRVSLAKLMLSEANFLILDEPTNHLDIMSKEILEDAINSYSGTVLYVSHDRYFINRTASRILELENGSFTGYLGNYDYYLEKKAENTLSVPETDGAFPPAAGGSREGNPSSSAASSLKQDWQSQKEALAAQRKKENALKRCESEIERLEKRSMEIDEEIDVYKRQISYCPARSSIWVGSFALFIFEVIAAQITVGLCLFPTSFCIINTGLIPPCSEPITGLKSA